MVHTQGVTYPGVTYPGGTYPGCTYRAYHGGYIPQGVPTGHTMVGIPLPTVLGIPWWVYLFSTVPGYTTLGIPPSLLHRWSLYYTPGVLHGVSRDGALGSTLRLIRDMRRVEPSQLPKV